MKVTSNGLLSYGTEELNMEANVVVRDEFDNVINYEFFTFSGGEEHVRIVSAIGGDEVYMIAKLRSSKSVMQMLMLNDALRRAGVKSITAFIPYMPYARQDRVCNLGEPLSVKVMADLINSCNFDSVEIMDPHSDVTGALINNLEITDQSTIFTGFFASELNMKAHLYTLVSPDAGAVKKIGLIARNMSCGVIEASKVRDTKTGHIIETKVVDDVTNHNCLIVDDICDGGRTFIELAKVLKAKGAKSVSLCVTHGIFSKGLEPLKEHIDHVYTTDSICTMESNNFLTVVGIDD